jgi:hypothetical protein
MGDRAQLAAGDQLAGRGHGRGVAVVEPDRALDPGLADGVGNRPGVVGGEADRLLDPDVLAGLGHGHADLAVEEVRRGDADRLHAGSATSSRQSRVAAAKPNWATASPARPIHPNPATATPTGRRPPAALTPTPSPLAVVTWRTSICREVGVKLASGLGRRGVWIVPDAPARWAAGAGPRRSPSRHRHRQRDPRDGGARLGATWPSWRRRSPAPARPARDRGRGRRAGRPGGPASACWPPAATWRAWGGTRPARRRACPWAGRRRSGPARCRR